MSKRRKVPEDLMGTILRGGHTSSSDEVTLSEAPSSKDTDRGTNSLTYASQSDIFWDSRPERRGVTFNLSKQVVRELDRLRLELQSEEGPRSSNSEIVEVALRIAIEDARERGTKSELLGRLNKASVSQSGITTDDPSSISAGTTADSSELTVERSVYGSGYILETTYSPQREIVNEELVGNVADLPVEDEYLDEKGRLISLSADELGNVFERVSDEESNMLGVRLARAAE
jgi:hypothetical protein